MNPTSLTALAKACDAYKAALISGQVEDDVAHALYSSAFDVFGCDELYDAARINAPSDPDPIYRNASLTRSVLYGGN